MGKKENYLSPGQQKLSRYAKAMSHPVRLFILGYLAEHIDSCCYSGDMAEELPIARSTLSEHLKELKKSGLIRGEINPPFIKYCIDREAWDEMNRLMSRFLNKSFKNEETNVFTKLKL